MTAMKTKTQLGKSSLALLATILFLASNAAIQAQTIYGSGSDGTNLVTINTTTGAGAVIGSFGYAATYGPHLALVAPCTPWWILIRQGVWRQ